MSSKPDDLEAVRLLADTLQPFASEDRERIIRWAREKLGMVSASASNTTKSVPSLEAPERPAVPAEINASASWTGVGRRH